MQNAALRVAVELGLLARLSEHPDKALSLGQLASSNLVHSSPKPQLSNESTETRKETNTAPKSQIADVKLIGQWV